MACQPLLPERPRVVGVVRVVAVVQSVLVVFSGSSSAVSGSSSVQGDAQHAIRDKRQAFPKEQE